MQRLMWVSGPDVRLCAQFSDINCCHSNRDRLILYYFWDVVLYLPVPPSPLLYCTVSRKIMVLIYGKENILERKCRKEETFWFLCNFYIKYIGTSIYVCIRWSGASSVLVHLTSERQGFDSRFCFKHNKNYIVADPRDPDSESGSCLN